MTVEEQSRAEALTRRRVTIVDVAERAGVSVAAVSKVLRGAAGVSDGMRERVQTAIAELRYRPRTAARGMRGRTFTVGIAVANVRNPFVPVLMDSVARVTREGGYELMAGPAGDGAEAQLHMIEAMIDRQMDGLVLVAPELGAKAIADVALRIPTVVIGGFGPSDAYDSVTGDDAVGAELIVDHLAALGHERIAFLSNRDGHSEDPHLPHVVRERGYLDAMERHGLGDHIHIVSGAWTEDGGWQAAREVLESDRRPTAFFAGADVAAFGVLAQFLEAGVDVPGQISVVGFDDVPNAAHPAISLTTVSQSGDLIGSTAARLLLDRFEGHPAGRHVVVDSTLIPRRSSGAPMTGSRGGATQ